MPNAAVAAAGPRTEKFVVPMGRYLGYVAVAIAAALIGYSLAVDRGDARGFVCFSLAAALLSYVVLIRPVVTAHADGLLLRNMVRDTFLPWATVKGCRVAQTLQVSTRDKTYHGLGVSQSARAANKQRRLRQRQVQIGPNTGLSRIQYMTTSTTPRAVGAQLARQEHVVENVFAHTEERIEALALERAQATADRSPVVAWQWPSVAALAAALVAVLVGFFG